jgi:hypothetical protein
MFLFCSKHKEQFGSRVGKKRPWLTGPAVDELSGRQLRAWDTDLVPLFPKGGRFRPDALPIEELVKAGPGVDLGAADCTVETTGALVLMLLLGRGVIHPAARAGKLFGRPDAVGHLLKTR